MFARGAKTNFERPEKWQSIVLPPVLLDEIWAYVYLER